MQKHSEINPNDEINCKNTQKRKTEKEKKNREREKEKENFDERD